jgi:hypothetical protein
MDTNSVAVPDAGKTRIARPGEPPLDYGWTLVAILAATISARAAGKIFWQRDSNWPQK